VAFSSPGECVVTRVTALLLGLVCFGIGYVATDIWLASDRWRGGFEEDHVGNHATLAFAMTAVWLALRLVP
jgi:hypothetical protein